MYAFRAAAFVCILGLIVSTASAARFDFSDAPGYGEAKHNSGEWQRLGVAWDKEQNARTPNLDTSDDGVSWSVNGGAFGFDTIGLGDAVTFRFDFHRAPYGRHASDTLAAWLDFDGDGVFHNVDEELVHDVWAKGDTLYPKDQWNAYIDQHGVVPNPDAVLQKLVEVTINIAEDMAVGEYWLRARVACNTSQQNNDPLNLKPYGQSRQGEVEDYPLTIVPEPSTLALLAFAGLAVGVRRR